MSSTGLWPNWRPNPDRYPTFAASPAIARHPSWGGASVDEIQQLFYHGGIGASRTLYSWGRRSMLHAFRDLGKHSIPCIKCEHLLKSWPCPRVQLLEPEKLSRKTSRSGEKTSRIDLPSAYPSHYRRHPCGTAVSMTREVDWIGTWFMECVISVPRELPLGPFPHREIGIRGKQRLLWPTAQGMYRSYLWKEQAEDARAAGCEVVPLRGYGWHQWTEDNARWVDWMLELRDTAPGGREGAVGTLVKRATNAAIGYQGIGRMYQRTVQATDWQEGDELCFDEDGRITDQVLRWFIGRGTMVHWQRYTDMQVSRTMYRMALPYALAGRLLAIWTDELEVAA